MSLRLNTQLRNKTLAFLQSCKERSEQSLSEAKELQSELWKALEINESIEIGKYITGYQKEIAEIDNAIECIETEAYEFRQEQREYEPVNEIEY